MACSSGTLDEASNQRPDKALIGIKLEHCSVRDFWHRLNMDSPPPGGTP